MPIPYLAQTWADGSGGGTPVSAARLNVIEAGIRDAHYMPAVRVYRSTAQSIGNSVNTSISFDSERYDQASNAASTMHDTVTNNSRLTCRYAGVYEIACSIAWAPNAAGYRQVILWLNGATFIAADTKVTVGTGIETQQTVSCHYSLAVNDYVEVLVSQNSGGVLNVNSGANYSPEFSMARVA